MSLEVLLIPIGIAAVAAIKEARSTDLCEKCRATRITAHDVLLEALTALGVSLTSTSDTRVTASSRWGALTFQKVGDIFLGRVDGADADTTDAMLNELDRTVGKVMQQRTAQQVIERAEALGFRLIQHQEDDGSLNYVFEEI